MAPDTSSEGDSLLFLFQFSFALFEIWTSAILPYGRCYDADGGSDRPCREGRNVSDQTELLWRKNQRVNCSSSIASSDVPATEQDAPSMADH